MSSQGTVMRWAKGYGFAEATTGEIVWIHKSVLPEDTKLKVGETVFFDMETVEGHGGRVKGINVSGSGIVPLDEKLSKEEHLAARAAWDEFKKDKLGPMSGSDAPKPAAKSAKPAKKTPGAAVGPKKAGGGVAEAAQKRIDPADGQAYTKEDFIACYGSTVEWNKAKPVQPVQPKGRGRGIGSAPYSTSVQRGRGRGAGAAAKAPAGRGAGKGGKQGKSGKGGKGARKGARH